MSCTIKMITMVKRYDTNANMKSHSKINELLMQINRVPDNPNQGFVAFYICQYRLAILVIQ